MLNLFPCPGNLNSGLTREHSIGNTPNTPQWGIGGVELGGEFTIGSAKTLEQTYRRLKWPRHLHYGCCRAFCAQFRTIPGPSALDAQSGCSIPHNPKIPMAYTKQSQKCGPVRHGLKHSGRAGKSRLVLQLSRSSQISLPRKCLTASSNSLVHSSIDPLIVHPDEELDPTSRPRSVAPRHVCQLERSDTPGCPAYGSRCTFRRSGL
jgi:hypothetical protein